VTLQLFLHEGGQSFGVPLKEDGSFTVGWMPIGKYSATLVREPPPGGRSGPRRHTVPDGLTIEDGKTDYTIDLGKNYKP